MTKAQSPVAQPQFQPRCSRNQLNTPHGYHLQSTLVPTPQSQIPSCFHLPSPVFLLPSSFSRLPSPVFLLPSPFETYNYITTFYPAPPTAQTLHDKQQKMKFQTILPTLIALLTATAMAKKCFKAPFQCGTSPTPFFLPQTLPSTPSRLTRPRRQNRSPSPPPPPRSPHILLDPRVRLRARQLHQNVPREPDKVRLTV
jgi:hypothetical protein